MSLITNVHTKEISDSRGSPAIEAKVETASGFVGCAIVPNRTSTGEREVLELCDGGPSRHDGKGILQVVGNVNNTLIGVVLRMDVIDQAAIDRALIDADGTKDKSRYGVNATLGISPTVAHAVMDYYGLSLYHYLGNINAKTLPVPMMDVPDSGGHTDSSVNLQEPMIMPVGVKSIHEATCMSAETLHALKEVLKSRGQVTTVGDEGGFALNLEDNEASLKCIMEATEVVGLRAGEDICIAMDVMASEPYNTGIKAYNLKRFGQGPKTTNETIAWYDELVEKYLTIPTEDGLGERDWDGRKKLTEHLGKKIQIIGDDLLVADPAILQEGIDKDIVSPILTKANQIGILTETFDTMELTKKHGYAAVVSYRDGETGDATIVDIAIAFNVGQIKTGSISRTDRIAKYNQLLHIEEELGDVALFQGKSAFYNICEH